MIAISYVVLSHQPSVDHPTVVTTTCRTYNRDHLAWDQEVSVYCRMLLISIWAHVYTSILRPLHASLHLHRHSVFGTCLSLIAAECNKHIRPARVESRFTSYSPGVCMYKGRLVTGCRVVAMGAALQVLLTDLHARPQCVWVQYYSD